MATMLKLDTELQWDVIQVLARDPEVEGAAIGVAVEEGIVTLNGTTRNFMQRWAAEQAALRVDGVRAVASSILSKRDGINQIPTTDTDIARAVADSMEWEPLVPFENVDIRVSNGHVTLEGNVDWRYQQAAALEATQRVRGVMSVTDLIQVVEPAGSVDERRQHIERAIIRKAGIDAGIIQVEIDGGLVTLNGAVGSWGEKRRAEDVARSMPGVHEVRNNLLIKLL